MGLIKYISHATLTEKYTVIVKIRCEDNIKMYTEIRIGYWSTHSKKVLLNFHFFRYFWLSLVFNFTSLYFSSFPEWINVNRFLWKKKKIFLTEYEINSPVLLPFQTQIHMSGSKPEGTYSVFTGKHSRILFNPHNIDQKQKIRRFHVGVLLKIQKMWKR